MAGKVHNDFPSSSLVQQEVRALSKRLGRNRKARQDPEESYRQVNSRSEPFSVKVSRKINNAKERFVRSVGMYGAVHVFPLGMYVDCYA